MQIHDKYPEELKKWHWGAFLWSPLWVLSNGCRLHIEVLAWLPVTSLFIRVYVGIYGYRLAMDHWEIKDPKDLIRSQRCWLRLFWFAVGVGVTMFIYGTVLSSI
jgi:hypothetical protein